MKNKMDDFLEELSELMKRHIAYISSDSEMKVHVRDDMVEIGDGMLDNFNVDDILKERQ